MLIFDILIIVQWSVTICVADLGFSSCFMGLLTGWYQCVWSFVLPPPRLLCFSVGHRIPCKNSVHLHTVPVFLCACSKRHKWLKALPKGPTDWKKDLAGSRLLPWVLPCHFSMKINNFLVILTKTPISFLGGGDVLNCFLLILRMLRSGSKCCSEIWSAPMYNLKLPAVPMAEARWASQSSHGVWGCSGSILLFRAAPQHLCGGGSVREGEEQRAPEKMGRD